MTDEQVREWLACVDLARQAKETGVELLLLGLVIWRLVSEPGSAGGARLLIVGEKAKQSVSVFLPPSTETRTVPGHLLHRTFRLMVGDKAEHRLSGMGRPTATPEVSPAPDATLVRLVIGRLKTKGLSSCMLRMPTLASTIFDDTHPHWEAILKPAVDAFIPEGD